MMYRKNFVCLGYTKVFLLLTCMSSLHAKFQGIDTLTYGEDEIGVQGNWIKKREWVLQAQELLTEMDTFLTELQEYEATFYQKKYDEIDAELNTFYGKIGVGSSAVESLIADVEKDLMAKLNASLEGVKDPSKRQRDAEQKAFDVEREIQRAKANVEQLKADMNLVADFDKAVNSRRAKAQEQSVAAQQARYDAENIFDKMTYIIDDTKARTVFYQIKGIYEQLQAMVIFVKTDLSQDTETIMSKTREQMARTMQQINQLEEQGAIILNRAQVMEELKAQEEARVEVEPEPVQRQKPERKPRGSTFQNWWSTVWFVGVAFVDTIKDLWGQFIGLFVVEKAQPNKQDTERPKQSPEPSGEKPEQAPASGNEKSETNAPAKQEDLSAAQPNDSSVENADLVKSDGAPA